LNSPYFDPAEDVDAISTSRAVKNQFYSSNIRSQSIRIFNGFGWLEERLDGELTQMKGISGKNRWG